MTFEQITRAEAAKQGRKRFYTGKACKFGHDAQRFVSTGACCACNAARSKTFSQAVGSKGFTYDLHPDDYAAALAYCQALDLQRGRMPSLPSAPKVAPAAAPLALPADLARHRQAVVAAHMPPAVPAHLPKP